MSGRVTLVGGGPGREDLLTVAAVRALAGAEVVLYDRLAPHEHLAELAPRAELVDVGKRPGHHAIPQHEIERLLVEHALAGRRVVRLKGGDPYVLGRGGEELAACRAAGIPVDVVPGVTSAVAVPGAAGIPLTHRGISCMFTVVSGHAPLSDAELGHLAGLGGTIVVLMGMTTLPATAAGLVRAGMAAGTPVAIVERGFQAGQRTTVAELGDVVARAAAVRAASPAIIVIGEVVRLAAGGDGAAREVMQRAAGLGASP
ncbi:uroporphyrinogen-III C-methyltransferase [Agromyces archimandritae]|uniref:uroporphyrinogen-III C-methyltransferase n=1 Tax=Agromyces archimandritae TaxID=2781962 RepID=A0A975FM72_9MICO|nr:uroporphyrinogen-III C-methyltransferase [Agromyces archimandritae]QTX04481.1 uroporphyrinogen-III C-methyltransferase [Agromyces archimandritae]